MHWTGLDWTGPKMDLNWTETGKNWIETCQRNQLKTEKKSALLSMALKRFEQAVFNSGGGGCGN